MAESGLEFSFRTRQKALSRFQSEEFDLLIIGGGITGAAVARDAISRGLSVALVERKDFAWGTSSRSSKLIHGGLRYLENREFGLVFEALSERTLLLKSAPHLVRPIPFYFPVFEGDAHGKNILGAGMWLYDMLSLFRSPGFHKRLSKDQFLEEIPAMNTKGLQGGFKYFDACMWDDVLAIELLRSANASGAVVANYVEALAPVWIKNRIQGFRVRDASPITRGAAKKDFEIRAKNVIVCAGPWTDALGQKLSPQWKNWLAPSKGVHLVLDIKKLPLEGAVVMSHKSDGRISFAIPRPEFGTGVVIVGTTDGPAPKENPESASIDSQDIQYLLEMLKTYFPEVEIGSEDLLSAYVGVRPLMAPNAGQGANLQKVSREHHIGEGPGGVVIVAGGKYTTHRTMAEEAVNFMLENWKREALRGIQDPVPNFITPSSTQGPPNPRALAEAVYESKQEAKRRGWQISDRLFERYGAEALDLMEIEKNMASSNDRDAIADPEGFPLIAAQLRLTIRTEMVLHLEDFFLRRLPLYASRFDHGLPWAEHLAGVWAEEKGLGKAEANAELENLKRELETRSAWKKNLNLKPGVGSPKVNGSFFSNETRA